MKAETLINEEATNGWIVDHILPVQTVLGNSLDYVSVILKKIKD